MKLILLGISVIAIMATAFGFSALQAYDAGKQLGEESADTEVFYEEERDGPLIKKEFRFPIFFWIGYHRAIKKARDLSLM
jgi:hypothetical protein